MKRSLFSVSAVLVLLLAVPLARAEEAGQNDAPARFRALFNGEDLAGWHGFAGDTPTRRAMAPAERRNAQDEADERMRRHWRVDDGVIQFDGRGESLVSADEFEDFELYVDWRIEPGGDSGIYLRGIPQVQIWDNAIGSGGLYNNQQHASKPLQKADHPVGEWNTFRIVMIGDRVTAWLNNVVVVENTPLENYWNRDDAVYERGPIELQAHNSPIQFRNIYVREIEDGAAEKALLTPSAVRPQVSGVLLLEPDAANLSKEGVGRGASGGKAYIGDWTDSDATATWSCHISDPGAYRVQARYAVAPNHGGAFSIRTGEEELPGRALSTTGWDVYRTVDFGTVHFDEAGLRRLMIEPTEVNEALMRLQFVRLVPVIEPLAEREPNTLTAAEKAAGWRLLFDGESTDDWRGYRREAFPERGWVVEGDALKVTAGGGGGDLMTVDAFENFELQLQFKVSHQANSGLMYVVTEEYDSSWRSGPEFQILDDIGYGIAPTNPHSVGAVYDLYTPPADKIIMETGGWNLARLRIENGVVEHWLNGVLITRFDMNSDDWKDRVESSKFRHYDAFGKPRAGHIVFQDHGHDVWFRDIKIRDLNERLPGEVTLFGGESLDGWQKVWAENAEPSDGTWRVENDVLVCSGNPRGYVKTTEEYESYVLMLDWRWSPVTERTGNSGVLTRVTGPDKVWPTCIEAQLMANNAGDFYLIGDYPMKTHAAGRRGIRGQKSRAMEYAPGEWNRYEIILDGPEVILKVNGEVVNYGWDAEVLAGPIALQSEGTEIHFRNVRLAPIEADNEMRGP